MRVTFNIPRDAAERLRLLAQNNQQQLRDLGILSVQIEGDQKASEMSMPRARILLSCVSVVLVVFHATKRLMPHFNLMNGSCACLRDFIIN